MRPSRQVLLEFPNTEFYKNPSGGSRPFPFKGTDGRTNMTRIAVLF